MNRPPQNAMPAPVDIRAYWTTVHVDGKCMGCKPTLKITGEGRLVDEPVMLVQVGTMTVRVCRSCRQALLRFLATEPPPPTKQAPP